MHPAIIKGENNVKERMVYIACIFPVVIILCVWFSWYTETLKT